MTAATTQLTRTDWVDYAKGTGILLVVFAHLLSSAYHSGLQIPERFFELADSIIYSFHMPVFFFLSGLFVRGSFDKRGAKAYTLDKFRRIVYPYLLWSLLQVSVEVMFSGQTQKGAGLTDLLAIPFRPWGQFWFLYALLLMHLIYVLLRPLGRLTMPVMFVLALGLFVFPIRSGAFALLGFSTHFLFFVLGIIPGSPILARKEPTVHPVLALLLSILLVWSGSYLFTRVIEPVRLVGTPYWQYFLALSILGIAAVMGLSQFLATGQLFRFFAVLGVYSLPIYLAHMLVGVGVRMALLQVVGIHNWVVHIVLGVLAALVLPMILQKVALQVHFPYLFELGRAEDTRPPGRVPLRSRQ